MEIKQYKCDKCGLMIDDYGMDKNYLCGGNFGFLQERRIHLCSDCVKKIKELLPIKK